MIEKSELPRQSSVLDAGCGIGGTSRYLAREHGCSVTGITISGKQVEIARKETGYQGEGHSKVKLAKEDGFMPFPPDHPKGAVRYIELDAERMGDFFTTPPDTKTFDCVWISEAMSHLPDKKLFFDNAFRLLNPKGRLVVADWFKAEDLTSEHEESDIKPIEGTLCSYLNALVADTFRRWHAPPTVMYAGRLLAFCRPGWSPDLLPSLRHQRQSVKDMVNSPI